MKKIYVLCVLFVLLTPLLTTAQNQEETPQAQKARVIVNKAPIYLESNPYSFIIDTVGRGTIVTLFQTGKKNKKWLYISYYSKKRMAQVTGFIDINLVEILSEKPKNPELSEEIEVKSVTTKQDELAVQSEAEGTAEEKKELEGKQQEAGAETEESSAAEKESSDPQKELAALEKMLKESEKKSEEETEERNQTRSEKEAGIKKESEEKQEEQKEIPVQAKPLTESVQKEKESVGKEQKVETAQEIQVKAEEKEAAGEENKTEEKSMEAVKKLEGLDEEMKAQTKEEEKNLEEHKEQAIEENYQEVLTKITIKVRKANIRLMPSLKSAVIHQLPFGVELEPLAKSGDWYRVNLPPNTDGFILSGYIHNSIVNETFEKQVLAPPVPEEPLESMLEIPEEELEPAPEPSQEIQPAERTGKMFSSFWIGGGAGYAMPSDSNFDKAINYGGTLGFEITRYLALELRVPYYKSHVTGTLGGLSTGQFQAISLTLSIQARYPIKNAIIPYLVGGGDYHLNKFTLDNEIVNSWNVMGFDIEESVEHSFGFHFGCGIDFFIMRSLALNLDVRYYTASMKGDWRLADSLSQVETTGPIDSIKLNSIQAAISVKFFLNR